MSVKIINAMSIDVEEYFQVSAFDNHIARSTWDSYSSRVESNVDRILALLEARDIRATFFILGWIAERYPQIVLAIADAGHEVASHGYHHILATKQSVDEFKEDVLRTKGLLEELTSRVVKGYRAPSYSIGSKNLWALDVLQRVGYEYSSSVYPIRHDLYGMPEAPRFPFRYRPGSLLEIPITTLKILRQNVPCGGGGYFRLFPYRFSKWAIGRINCVERQPSVFYFHPWEIDPAQPRQIGIGFKTRVRHYLNLERMEQRLKRLLDDFNWGRIDNAFSHLLKRNIE